MSQNFLQVYPYDNNSMLSSFFLENEMVTSSSFSSNNDLNVQNKKPYIDPFSKECKIPLPTWIQNQDVYDNFSGVQKRNERERARVKNVNEGFDRLRKHLPLTKKEKEKRLSKVETLRLAIRYIRQLNCLLKLHKIN